MSGPLRPEAREQPSASAAIPSARTTSTQPAAERDANIATVLAVLIAPAGIAGGWLGQSLVHTSDTIPAGALALAVVVAVVPPLALALVADALARRAVAAAELPLRRARVVRRAATPFAFVGAVVGFLVALGAVFVDAFLH